MTVVIHVITIENETPPSLNSYSHAHWRKYHSIKKSWQNRLGVELMEMRKRLAPAAQVHATAQLRFPTRRRRDEGNYRAALEKSLGDALVEGGYLVDDTPEQFTFGALTFDDTPGQPRTTLQLRWTERKP